jgi:hypothetical protein
MDDIFEVGDLVTRDGTDVHRVVEVGDYNDITVVCVRAPSRGWCKVGDKELNLAGRYQHAGLVVDQVRSVVGLPE